MAKPTRHGKNWRIRWHDANGKRKSKVFPNYETALYHLEKCRVEVQEEKRGLRKPSAPNKSFGDVTDLYKNHRSNLKKSKKDDYSILKAHLMPFFGNLLLVQIDSRLTDKYVLEKQHLNPKTINNHLTLLIAILNYAKEIGWLHSLPKIKKPRVQVLEQDFSYLKSDSEIQKLLNSAYEEGEIPYLLYMTAIYTGMRAGELAALTWDDIDLDRQLISVRKSFDGTTKNSKIRHVPVVNYILPHLKKWKLKCPSEYVFPNQRGDMQKPSNRIFQEILKRVLNRAEFPKVKRNGKLSYYIRFHDFRHTFASIWLKEGGSIFKLQRILGHQSMQMTLRYSHLSPDAFEEDLDRFGRFNELSVPRVLKFTN